MTSYGFLFCSRMEDGKSFLLCVCILMSVHGLSAQVRVRANSGSWRQRGRITVDFINRMFAMGGVSVPVPDAIDAFLGLWHCTRTRVRGTNEDEEEEGTDRQTRQEIREAETREAQAVLAKVEGAMSAYER